MITTRLTLALAAGFLLAACGEKPQTAETRKSDGQAWASGPTAYHAQGWKPGDKASWEQQLRERAQAQNEYARTSAKPQ